MNELKDDISEVVKDAKNLADAVAKVADDVQEIVTEVENELSEFIYYILNETSAYLPQLGGISFPDEVMKGIERTIETWLNGLGYEGEQLKELPEDVAKVATLKTVALMCDHLDGDNWSKHAERFHGRARNLAKGLK